MKKTIELKNFNNKCKFYKGISLLVESEPDLQVYNQLDNILNMPNYYRAVGLPDLHGGYHFPIGTASTYKPPTIDPMGVGFDIGCGVNMSNIGAYSPAIIEAFAKFNLEEEAVRFRKQFDKNFINGILDSGLEYLERIGLIKDRSFVENRGSLKGNHKIIHQKCRSKAFNQLGSLGKGNHFLELQKVEKIYNETAAQIWNLNEDSCSLMIHTGSRKLGHLSTELFYEENENRKQRFKLFFIRLRTW